MKDQDESLPTAPADGQRLLQWVLHDGCFATLWFFLIGHQGSKTIIDWLSKHEAACGGWCMHRVRMTAATTEDRDQKQWYRFILEHFMIRWLKMNGGDHDVRFGPEGMLFVTRFVPGPALPYELLFTQIEVFLPADRSRQGHVIFDVRRAELFEDPRPLVQHLDVTATREVKLYPAETGPLHWKNIFADREPKLRIRWQGKVKELARDWTLHGRYGKLVERHRPPDADEGVSGDVLQLRETALRYDERSWFSGFLRQSLGYRRKDAWRRVDRDPVYRADPLPTPGGDGSVGEAATPDQSGGVIRRLDNRLMTQRLLRGLKPIQLKILELKLSGRTDTDIAAQLGVRRETVSRHMTRIKKVAARCKRRTA